MLIAAWNYECDHCRVSLGDNFVHQIAYRCKRCNQVANLCRRCGSGRCRRCKGQLLNEHEEYVNSSPEGPYLLY